MPDGEKVAEAVERLLEALPEDESSQLDVRLRARLAGYVVGLRQSRP